MAKKINKQKPKRDPINRDTVETAIRAIAKRNDGVCPESSLRKLFELDDNEKTRRNLWRVFQSAAELAAMGFVRINRCIWASGRYFDGERLYVPVAA